MQENLWGMTCNQVIWTCPDCGRERPFGNQWAGGQKNSGLLQHDCKLKESL